VKRVLHVVFLSALDKIPAGKMKCTFKISSLLKEVELRKKPIIVRVNKFNEESAKKFDLEVSQAHNTGQRIIPIVIDSFGGTVYSLMSMISTIRHADLPVATIVKGKAMSCGAVLFTFGKDGLRFMDPHATLMIHDVSCMGRGKVEEIKSSAAEADRLNELIYSMMARNCGKGEKYFMTLMDQKKHADWFLDASEALKYNIANHLRVPALKVEVSVNIDFE